MVYAPCSGNAELPVGGADLHAAKAHAVGIAAHACAQPQRQPEVLQHGGEGTGDVAEYGAPGDDACAVGQRRVGALVGQDDAGGIDAQRGGALLNGNVGKMEPATVVVTVEGEAAHVDAGSGIAHSGLLDGKGEAVGA